MPSERAERVEELVAAALARRSDERGAFLRGACADDPTLLAEVESLLGFENAIPSCLGQPAYQADAAHWAAEASSGLGVGQMLGGYRILSRLGEGGMGEVFLAEDQTLGRKVALKVVKRGLSAGAFRQFVREERILAALNDPHIARLYGGAVSLDGLPYFVMEYVEGRDLDDYCREEKLDLPARLTLFRKVCAAVNYAHQCLVIHRDLKPANIRVTAEGEPKLLDFGIAKVLDPDAAERVDQTVTLAPAMTPQYASPEQLRGDRITTASDIYSLGVVLYELLTGERPYKLQSQRPDEVARTILETDTPRPSTVAGEFRRQLAGDLDNIVLKAMRKEPERRYSSAAQLSEDLRRHLEGHPVLARKETFQYVAAKFFRRNKAAVVAGLLVLLSLVGGMIATLAQARRAERRFDEVRRLANSLMFEIHDSVQNLPGSTPTRKLIVSRALEYLDRLATEAGGNTALQRELATAYEKIGDIQGNPYSANLGDTDGALASYRKAEAIYEQLRGVEATPATQIALGCSYRALGDILEVKGDVAGMIQYYRRSLEIIAAVAAGRPNDFAAQDEWARAYETLGDGLQRIAGAQAERLQCYQRLLEIRQGLLVRFPDNPRNPRSTALALLKLGRNPGVARPVALALVRQAIERFEVLSTKAPDDARSLRELGFGCNVLGNLLNDSGDFAAALEARRRAFTIRQKLASQDPQNSQMQFDLAVSHADLAESLLVTEALPEALEESRQGFEILERLAAADPGNVMFRRNTAYASEVCGRVHERLAVLANQDPPQRAREWDEACAWLEKARDLLAAQEQEHVIQPDDVPRLAKLIADLAQDQTKAAEARK